jgi:TP901 family phage tail tape measure protein
MDGSAKVTLILELKERIKSGLGKAKSIVNENVKEMKDKLNSLKAEHIKTFQSMKDEVPGLGRALELVTNPYVLLTASVIALGTAYYKAASFAVDWEGKMAHANVTAQLSKTELAKLSKTLEDIGTRNVAPLENVPDAFNRIISTGLDVNTSLQALEPTLRAAKAGFTDMETTAAAGVGVMNASGENINKVYDTLFATVNKSNAEFKDIAQYLPKIIPNAKAAGFALGETAGAWAYLSAQGRNAEQSTTGLLNLFKAFANPNTFEGLKEMGVSVFDATGKMRPMINIITDLSKKMSGLSDQKRATKMGALGIDMEGLGALNTMMQDTGKLNEIIQFTTNSTGQLDEAYKDAAQSGDSWAIIMNKVKAGMLDIGQTALPVIESVGKWFLDNGPVLEYFADTVLGMAAAWGTYILVTNAATIATGLWTAAMWLLDVAMNLNPIGLLITAIGALIGGLIYAYKNCTEFRAGINGLIEVGKLLMDVFVGLGKVLIGMWTFDPSMVIDGMKQTANSVAEIAGGGIAKAFNKGYNDTMESMKVANTGDYNSLMPGMGENTKPFSMVPTDAFADKKKATPKAKKLDNTPEGDSVNKITEGSKKVQNITVNIDAFVKGGINTNNTKGLNGMSAQDIEKWFNDALMRALRNLETSYS